MAGKGKNAGKNAGTDEQTPTPDEETPVTPVEETPTPTPDEETPEAPTGLKAKLQARIGAGGISPESIDTLTPYIEATANSAEQLRLLMEIYDDTKGLKRGRLEKIKGEVLHAVEDWVEATGETIHAWPETVEVADLVKEITGLNEAEFEKAFRMKKACVDYDNVAEE